MRSPCSPAAALCVGAVLAGACAARPQRGAAVALEPLPKATQDDVRLLDAGPEPRQELRYGVIPGITETLVLDLTTSLALSVGEMGIPDLRSPSLRLTLALGTRAVDPQGRIAIEGGFTAVEVLPTPDTPAAVRTAVASDLERLKAVRLAGLLTDRGRLERLTFEGPTEANPQLATTVGRIRDAIAALFLPLPDQPVGRGARWQARRPAHIGPALARETTVYTLHTLSGGRARASVALELAGTEQNPTVAGLPPGATLAISRVSGAGGGMVDVDLRRLVPRAELRWSATAIGSTQPVGEPPAPVRMTVTASLTTQPPP